MHLDRSDANLIGPRTEPHSLWNFSASKSFTALGSSSPTFSNRGRSLVQPSKRQQGRPGGTLVYVVEDEHVIAWTLAAILAGKGIDARPFTN